MKLFADNLCFICLKNTEVEQHHTSYKDDETIPLCGSCHSKVHLNDGFHDDLEPELSRKEASRNGHVDAQNGVTLSVYVSDDDLVDTIERVVENSYDYRNYSHLFVKSVKKLLDEYNNDSDTNEFV